MIAFLQQGSAEVLVVSSGYGYPGRCQLRQVLSFVFVEFCRKNANRHLICFLLAEAVEFGQHSIRQLLKPIAIKALEAERNHTPRAGGCAHPA